MTNSPTHLRPSPNLSPFHNPDVVAIQRLYLSPISTKPIKLAKTLCCSSQPQTPPRSSSSHDLTFISILRAIPDWADRVKEGRMQTKRELYDHESWVQHRSSLRHLRHLASSLSSRVILSLIPPVIAFTTVAVVIAVYNTAVMAELLPELFPVLRASTLPYQLTAPALALLLVFRTEASYSRFEEGRKAWTKVIVGSNDLARQVIASVEDKKDDGAIKKSLLQYIIAFPVALKCHLVYGSDIRRDLQHVLEADELAVIVNSKNSPRCVIEFISQSLQLLNLDESKRNLLEVKLSSFHEGIGVCEQLMGIPIPLSYTRLTSRFLFLWHITLPIILWDDCHWIVVPATFISAAALFCIEEVGVLIEEPFPMLPLDEVCEKIEASIREAIASEKLIKAKLVAKRQRFHNGYSTNGRPGSQME
uniref:Uncharacterized protein n=1 Tax=Kalanchoe fedtschenkoi TaxID=63787 RepID=A0A7N0UXM1_KALFE